MSTHIHEHVHHSHHDPQREHEATHHEDDRWRAGNDAAPEASRKRGRCFYLNIIGTCC